ncbi:efflux RND transporter periplasmic adaptor subunit [Marinomonas sp. IMCC 4694]|uniref:efflux RND transporter periplasmic adaptor subunit n=1 Tax=Marinomonas sp. IMCC 4694 TaxID=2605432 RepID=UPI0011E70B8B|nr:efflux RND transporter periplasmic adaptor subunit [Marinomonas sp. IMCC 4694]TYL48391.1 efflux RND transporter periplasmic adaptor subunit [Marinomonas sp. IMCC 4694]
MKQYLSQWITILVAIGALAGVYFYVSNAVEAQKNTVQAPRPIAPEQALEIATLTTNTGSYAATISASGIVKPRYSLTLSNQVSGEIIVLSDQFESGQVIKKGQVLLQLENSELTSAVANAQNTLAAAQLALKEEQRQGEQAKAEWAAAGFNSTPESDLVLRTPQLKAAQAQVSAAKASLTSAQTKLQHTKIAAPYDALVVARQVSLGSYLGTGSDVGTLYSVDRADIEVDLSSSDWLKLPDFERLLAEKWPVDIANIDDESRWQGHISSINQHIDDTTRMRRLTVSVNSPLNQTPALLPGAFVTLLVKGKPLNNLWRLPSTALSQKSEIWYIDQDSRLAAFETTPRFFDAQYVYIQVPDNMINQTYQVLVQPYNSYIKGTLATSSTATKENRKP